MIGVWITFLFHMFQGTSGLTFRVGQAGTYYMDVHSGQPKDWGTATSQNYSLLVNATYCNDVYEPNDDISHATPITLGVKDYCLPMEDGENCSGFGG